MMRWLLVPALCFGCGKTPSDEQCKQLLDHLVTLEFDKAGAKEGGKEKAESQKAELAKQRDKVIEAKTTEFMAQCTKKTATDRVECALAATTLDEVAKCDTEDQ
jgi:hypothetical protein